MMGQFKLVCVVAMADNRVIGDGDDLLWHLPGDLRRVKALTMGCPLIMGRKTWDSIGRPLPGRASIVLTRDKSWSAEGAIAVSSLAEAFDKGKDWLQEQGQGEDRLILFGGGQIYDLGLPLCQEIELTKVNLSPDAPAKFPEIDAADWVQTDLEAHAAGDDNPAFSYHRLTRKGAPVFI